MAVNVADLGRRKGISRSGLSAVLNELKDKQFPDATSRQTIKRRRDSEVDVQTRYGRMLQSWKVTLPPLKSKKKKKTGVRTKAKASKTVEIPFIQPIPLLCHLCLECPQFSGMMLKVLDDHMPSQDKPLSIICYNDAISPGNVLAHNQGRKVECVYWSIKEFGDLALTQEKNWFLLGIMRCELVKRLPGKTSQYFREAVERFFSPVDLRHGIQLVFPDGQRRMLFCDLAIVVGDEVALKECFDMKGASGTVLCPLCRNLVDRKSELAAHSAEFVSSNTCSLEGVDMHSDQTLMETIKFIQDNSKQDMSQTAFGKIQQSLGFNHNEFGLLQSPYFLKPASSLMFDWMHTYCVGGLWNVELGNLLTKLTMKGIDQERLDAELVKFTWPKSLMQRGVTGMKIFSKGDQEGDIKCSASEALSVYSVLRFILLDMVQNEELDHCKEIDSYLRLSSVMDVLVWGKRHGWDTDLLQTAVREHLVGYASTYHRFLPKHHYSLHLAPQCALQSTLVSCWVHERKHKEIKRHANLICNTWGAFEKSVLVDAKADMIKALAGNKSEPFYGGICDEVPAPQAVAAELKSLGFVGPFYVARSAFFSPGQRAWVDDVVLLSDFETLGEVNFFFRCGQTPGKACLTLFSACGRNEFEKNSSSVVLELSELTDTVTYCSGRSSSTLRVVPSSMWLSAKNETREAEVELVASCSALSMRSTDQRSCVKRFGFLLKRNAASVSAQPQAFRSQKDNTGNITKHHQFWICQPFILKITETTYS